MRLLNTLSMNRAKALFQAKIVEARCLATDQVYQCVYIRDTSVDGLYRVGRSDPANVQKMPSIGVIIEKETSTLCKVQLFGIVPVPGITAGRSLYVGVTGLLVDSPPLPPAHTRYLLQKVGTAVDDDVAFIYPDNIMYGKLGVGL